MMWLAAAAIASPSARKYSLDLAKYPNARCLDGSPGAFYISLPATPSPRWYIYQRGGGFCTTLEDCETRSHTDLGSSLAAHWPAAIDLDSYAQFMGFDRNVTKNPLLSGFAHVFLVCKCGVFGTAPVEPRVGCPNLNAGPTPLHRCFSDCDGAYFSGSNSTRTVAPRSGAVLHFRGQEIFEATVQTLVAEHGLGAAAATEVVLGGCSAGGIATFAHADWAGRVLAAAGALPRGTSRYSAFPISGYYLDVDYFTDQKRFPYAQSNVSASLDARCVAEQSAASPPTPHKCLVASVNARFLRTPTFVFQSKYDADQLASSFNPPCTDAVCADPYAANLSASIARELWGDGDGDGDGGRGGGRDGRRDGGRDGGGEGAGGANGNGGFVDGCWHHCSYAPGKGDNVGAIAAADGTTPLQGFAQWYASQAPGGKRWTQHAPTFPCTACCSVS